MSQYKLKLWLKVNISRQASCQSYCKVVGKVWFTLHCNVLGCQITFAFDFYYRWAHDKCLKELSTSAEGKGYKISFQRWRLTWKITIIWIIVPDPFPTKCINFRQTAKTLIQVIRHLYLVLHLFAVAWKQKEKFRVCRYELVKPY